MYSLRFARKFWVHGTWRKFCGASHRKKRFWIPDQVRNDEVLGVSPGVGFGNAQRNPRKNGMRRIRAGEIAGRMIIRPYIRRRSRSAGRAFCHRPALPQESLSPFLRALRVSVLSVLRAVP
jgi:hypothetical protein